MPGPDLPETQPPLHDTVESDPLIRIVAASPSIPPGALEVGAVLDGRYRIVRFLAAGGMGEVYEARDEVLGEHVALKTLRAALRSAQAFERFKREILLARRVTHPNVCRILELGRHRLPSGDELLFLTMELLEGETLADRIGRAGRLTPSEALAAVTINAATALGIADEVGSIESGRQADLAIWAVPSHRQIPYWPAADLVRTVVKRGRVVFERPLA